MDGSVTLIHRIAALHVVYDRNRPQVLWFGQLVTLSPEVMIYLHSDNISRGDEMVYLFLLPTSFVSTIHYYARRFFIFVQLSKP